MPRSKSPAYQYEHLEWDRQTIDQLESLWNLGLSASEIGRRMKCSKNSVVGKAHRLGLPQRPSPIIRHGAPQKPPSASRGRHTHLRAKTLRPLISEVVEATLQPEPEFVPTIQHVEPPAPDDLPALVERLKPAQLATKPVFAAPAPTPQPPRAFGRVTDCCWPLGDPGTRSFRFCGEVSDRGFPYCSAHRSVAYVKRRPDETEAIISRAEQSAA